MKKIIFGIGTLLLSLHVVSQTLPLRLPPGTNTFNFGTGTGFSTDSKYDHEIQREEEVQGKEIKERKNESKPVPMKQDDKKKGPDFGPWEGI